MLKNKREKLNLSQRKLAKRLKKSQGYISKVENRRFNNVTVRFIKKISIELELNPICVFIFFYSQLK